MCALDGWLLPRVTLGVSGREVYFYLIQYLYTVPFR